MKIDELRLSFIDYFKSKDHKLISANPLPIDDPTLLFTVAGMVPLKKYFLGEEKPPNNRLTSVQRCLRTNDIEKVGKTFRHHTFFEMLGNFSIGDYFKEEAIVMALEFLNKTLSIPLEKLWVSVYPDDIEAKSIWKKFIPEDRTIELKENFWKMADTGPCGFDSEIYFDLGKDVGCGRVNCDPSCECERFVEIWNLVFTEFNLEKDGSLSSLPRKNIDTGMGFERLTAVVSGVKSNFETDLFIPIEEKIEELSKKKKKDDIERFNLIADHIRAITFLIADGVFPENQKHGYVLRRLIRRAKLSGYILGIDEFFLNPLCEVVIDLMGNYYTYLRENQNKIKLIVESEEEQFSRTLRDGLKYFNDELEKSNTLFSGEVAFKLHDTYGFPIELTSELLNNTGLKLDEEKFNSLYEEQKKRAKLETSFSSTLQKSDFWIKLRDSIGKTDFVGYESDSLNAIIQCIIKNDIPINKASCKDTNIMIILNKTPFFPEKGGPIGDKGIIYNDEFKFKVENTVSPLEGLIVHKGTIIKGEIKIGDIIKAEVDSELRRGIRRAHTSTHLLHSALKRIIGDYINQSGSFVDCDYLRFDFNALNPLNNEELIKIEEFVNDAIEKNFCVCVKEMSYSQAISEGATALFKEKYGEKVRVVSIDKVSKELCAGIHVNNTQQILLFKIIKEIGIGSNLRRIEAFCGKKAYRSFREDTNSLNKIRDLINKPNVDVVTQVKSIIEENQRKDIDLKELERKLINYLSEEIINESKKIGFVRFAFKSLKGVNNDYLMELADTVRDKSDEPIMLLLASIRVNNTNMVLASSSQIDLQRIFSLLKEKFSLRGGGKGNLIQIGGVVPERIGEIIEFLKKILNE